MKKIYQGMLVLSIILYCMYWFSPFYTYAWFSDDGLLLVRYSGFESIIGLEASKAITWLCLILYVLIIFGLFKFYYYARVAFLWFTVMNTVIGAFSGWVVMHPFQAVTINIVVMLDGAILVFSYFTSLNEVFKKNKTIFGQLAK